jgi:glycosyltransferase involved in cell wall biosynthesis
MKPHVHEPRSQPPRTRVTAAETLRSARTVTHRVQPMAARRHLASVGFEDLTAHVPHSGPQRVIPHVRPAVRIAYVVDQFPRGPHGFLLEEILELESRGIDVHIFSLRMPEGRVDDTACALARLRGPVRYFSEIEGFASDGSSIDGTFHYTFAIDSLGQARMGRGLSANAARWVANQVASRDIEHIHAHGATVATDVAREAARLSGRGYSFTAYADGLYEGANEPSLCEKVLNARFAVTLNESDRRRLVKVGGASASAKVHRIPISVNPDDYRFSTAGRLDSDSILAIGPLAEKSGFSDLIEAVGILRDRGRVARLTILGEGEYEETLRAQIDQCRLAGRIQIVGGLSRGEISMLMQAHTALVLPWVADDCDREVLANVVLEAMAVGLVVLSTDVPGIRELIDDGMSGRVISPRDPLWLAGALETLFDSPELRGRMAVRARSRVARMFSASRNVSQLGRLFVRTVARNGLAT